MKKLALLATAATFSIGVLATASVNHAQAKSADYVILKIGKDEIKKSQVIDIWNGLFPAGQAPDFESFDEKVKQNVLRGVVSEHMIYKQAVESGAEKDKEVQKQLEMLKKKLVTQAHLNKKAEKSVTDKTLKAEYEAEIKKLEGKKEIKARHILVEKEDDAKAILDQLNDGGDFEKLAKELSKDKGSAVKGGDLGYFGEGTMVEEFSKAAFALKKGELSKPVKTAFGWHIIKLEDSRDVKKPSFDELKPTLTEKLKADALRKYVYDLMDSADVSYFDKSGKKLEFSRTPDETAK